MSSESFYRSPPLKGVHCFCPFDIVSLKFMNIIHYSHHYYYYYFIVCQAAHWICAPKRHTGVGVWNRLYRLHRFGNDLLLKQLIFTFSSFYNHHLFMNEVEKIEKKMKITVENCYKKSSETAYSDATRLKARVGDKKPLPPLNQRKMSEHWCQTEIWLNI